MSEVTGVDGVCLIGVAAFLTLMGCLSSYGIHEYTKKLLRHS